MLCCRSSHVGYRAPLPPYGASPRITFRPLRHPHAGSRLSAFVSSPTPSATTAPPALLCCRCRSSQRRLSPLLLLAAPCPETQRCTCPAATIAVAWTRGAGDNPACRDSKRVQYRYRDNLQCYRYGSTHTTPCYRLRLATHTIMRRPNKGRLWALSLEQSTVWIRARAGL